MAVDVLARDGHEQHAGTDRPRIMGHAGHLDARQIGRWDGTAVPARAAQPAVRGEPRHQSLEQATVGLAHRARRSVIALRTRLTRDVIRPTA